MKKALAKQAAARKRPVAPATMEDIQTAIVNLAELTAKSFKDASLRLDKKIDDLAEKTAKSFAAVAMRFDRMDERFDKMDEAMRDQRIELRTEIHELKSPVHYLMRKSIEHDEEIAVIKRRQNAVVE